MDNKGIHPRSSPCDVDNLLSEGFVAEGAEMTKSKNTTVLTIVATQRWEQPRSIQVQPDTGVDKLCLINTTYPPPYPAGLGWIRSLPRTKAPLLLPMFWGFKKRKNMYLDNIVLLLRPCQNDHLLGSF